MTKHKSHEGQEFHVTIDGKSIEVTNALREHVLEKLEKCQKLVHQIIDVHVRLEVQKLDHLIDVIMKFGHVKIKVHAKTPDMYASIDKAFEKLLGKLRKWKDKIQDHHAKSIAMTEMDVEVLEHRRQELESVDEDLIEDNNLSLTPDYEIPKVSRNKKRNLKTLTLSEAVMKMELSDDHFLVFKGEEDNQIKVLYRRRKSGYGIMSPS